MPKIIYSSEESDEESKDAVGSVETKEETSSVDDVVKEERLEDESSDEVASSSNVNAVPVNCATGEQPKTGAMLINFSDFDGDTLQKVLSLLEQGRRAANAAKVSSNTVATESNSVATTSKTITVTPSSSCTIEKKKLQNRSTNLVQKSKEKTNEEKKNTTKGSKTISSKTEETEKHNKAKTKHKTISVKDFVLKTIKVESSSSVSVAPHNLEKKKKKVSSSSKYSTNKRSSSKDKESEKMKPKKVKIDKCEPKVDKTESKVDNIQLEVNKEQEKAFESDDDWNVDVSGLCDSLLVDESEKTTKVDSPVPTEMSEVKFGEVDTLRQLCTGKLEQISLCKMEEEASEAVIDASSTVVPSPVEEVRPMEVENSIEPDRAAERLTVEPKVELGVEPSKTKDSKEVSVGIAPSTSKKHSTVNKKYDRHKHHHSSSSSSSTKKLENTKRTPTTVPPSLHLKPSRKGSVVSGRRLTDSEISRPWRIKDVKLQMMTRVCLRTLQPVVLRRLLKYGFVKICSSSQSSSANVMRSNVQLVSMKGDRKEFKHLEVKRNDRTEKERKSDVRTDKAKSREERTFKTKGRVDRTEKTKIRVERTEKACVKEERTSNERVKDEKTESERSQVERNQKLKEEEDKRTKKLKEEEEKIKKLKEEEDKRTKKLKEEEDKRTKKLKEEEEKIKKLKEEEERKEKLKEEEEEERKEKPKEDLERTENPKEEEERIENLKEEEERIKNAKEEKGIELPKEEEKRVSEDTTEDDTNQESRTRIESPSEEKTAEERLEEKSTEKEKSQEEKTEIDSSRESEAEIDPLREKKTEIDRLQEEKTETDPSREAKTERDRSPEAKVGKRRSPEEKEPSREEKTEKQRIRQRKTEKERFRDKKTGKETSLDEKPVKKRSREEKTEKEQSREVKERRQDNDKLPVNRKTIKRLPETRFETNKEKVCKSGMDKEQEEKKREQEEAKKKRPWRSSDLGDKQETSPNHDQIKKRRIVRPFKASDNVGKQLNSKHSPKKLASTPLRREPPTIEEKGPQDMYSSFEACNSLKEDITGDNFLMDGIETDALEGATSSLATDDVLIQARQVGQPTTDFSQLLSCSVVAGDVTKAVDYDDCITGDDMLSTWNTDTTSSLLVGESCTTSKQDAEIILAEESSMKEYENYLDDCDFRGEMPSEKIDKSSDPCSDDLYKGTPKKQLEELKVQINGVAAGFISHSPVKLSPHNVMLSSSVCDMVTSVTTSKEVNLNDGDILDCVQSTSNMEKLLLPNVDTEQANSIASIESKMNLAAAPFAMTTDLDVAAPVKRRNSSTMAGGDATSENSYNSQCSNASMQKETVFMTNMTNHESNVNHTNEMDSVFSFRKKEDVVAKPSNETTKMPSKQVSKMPKPPKSVQGRERKPVVSSLSLRIARELGTDINDIDTLSIMAPDSDDDSLLNDDEQEESRYRMPEDVLDNGIASCSISDNRRSWTTRSQKGTVAWREEELIMDLQRMKNADLIERFGRDVEAGNHKIAIKIFGILQSKVIEPRKYNMIRDLLQAIVNTERKLDVDLVNELFQTVVKLVPSYKDNIQSQIQLLRFMFSIFKKSQHLPSSVHNYMRANESERGDSPGIVQTYNRVLRKAIYFQNAEVLHLYRDATEVGIEIEESSLRSLLIIFHRDRLTHLALDLYNLGCCMGIYPRLRIREWPHCLKLKTFHSENELEIMVRDYFHKLAINLRTNPRFYDPRAITKDEKFTVYLYLEELPYQKTDKGGVLETIDCSLEAAIRRVSNVFVNRIDRTLSSQIMRREDGRILSVKSSGTIQLMALLHDTSQKKKSSHNSINFNHTLSESSVENNPFKQNEKS